MKRVKISVLQPSETARRAELGGFIPLGSAGAYAHHDQQAAEATLEIFYPSVKAMLTEISGLDWTLFDALRSRHTALSVHDLQRLSNEEFMLNLKRQLDCMLELQIIARQDGELYVAMYDQVEITI